jgi:hypothetical protein
MSRRGIERLPLSEARAQELIDFLFATKRWQRDPEHLLRKTRKFRQEAVVEGRAAQEREGDWAERARSLHQQNPQYWSVGRLAHVVTRSRTEVERAMAGAME